MDFDIPRRRLPGLCLLFIGVAALLTMGVGGPGSPQAANAHSIEESGSIYRFSELPADAQQIVVDGTDNNSSPAVEDLPEAFNSTEVTIVRNDGELFCVRREGGRIYSTNATEGLRTSHDVSSQNCAEYVFDFETLSPRGKAVVSATLDSSSNQIDLRTDAPEFSAAPTYDDRSAGEEISPGSGLYYIVHDGTVYQLTIREPAHWSTTGGTSIALVFGGVILTVYGLVSYRRATVFTPLLVIAIVSMFVLPALFSLVGLHRWSIWLAKQPQLFIGAILSIFTGIGISIYRRNESDNGEQLE